MAVVGAVLLAVMMLPMAYFLFAILVATWESVEPLHWAPYRSFLSRGRAEGAVWMEYWFWFLVVWGVMNAVLWLIIKS